MVERNYTINGVVVEEVEAYATDFTFYISVDKEDPVIYAVLNDIVVGEINIECGMSQGAGFIENLTIDGLWEIRK